MKYYAYDEKTKEFIGEFQAELDPLETKAQGKNVYLLPANSTFVEPPVIKVGFAIVFNNKWVYIADHRGNKCIKDGKITEIKELGEFDVITPEQEKGLLEGKFLIEKDKIREKTYQEMQSDLSAQKRSERDAMLKATDIYMLSDYPISYSDRQKYISYRQYLRDLPQALKFPDVSVMTFEEWCQCQNNL